MSTWHGYQITDQLRPNRPAVTLGVGPIPKRRGVALYIATGATLRPVAYFRSDREARKVLKLLDLIVKGEPRG